jgi:predicted DCC family thiol-disulfide oxidoreductase YuxK
MEPAAIVLFDGVCNLCHRSVLFIIDRDPARRFRFATLQSEPGQTVWDACRTCSDASTPTGEAPEMPAKKLRTLVLVEGDRCYIESTAALRIARRLKGPWPLLYSFILIPPFLRDPLYRWVSRHRYRWFSRSEVCRLPSPATADRFIDTPRPGV